jgi:DNA phosphorothioation-dependent restriction protein DptH
MQENNTPIYAYLSSIILGFFLKGRIKAGEKYHIKFEKQDDVDTLYQSLRDNAAILFPELELGSYTYNDYNSYYITFKKTKLIIAAHPNGDFLTGLRNNFDKVEDFADNAAILFIHSTQLESINKGATSFSARSMPFHIDSIRDHIIRTFEEDQENDFSKTHKEFIRQILKIDTADYQIESKSLFDLKKYINILVKGKLSKEDFNVLGLFPDKKILLEDVPAAEIKHRLSKNNKWFTEMTRAEQLGFLPDYLAAKFDRSGQNKLSNIEKWPDVYVEELIKSEENRELIQFNDYVCDQGEITPDGETFWEKEEGLTTLKSQIRNIIIFNPGYREKLGFKLDFKKKPNLKYLNHASAFKVNFKAIDAELSEDTNRIDLIFNVSDPTAFASTQIEYVEQKEGKSNETIFKILIAPIQWKMFDGIKAIYKVVKPNTKRIGIELYSNDEIIFNDQGLESELITFQPDTKYDLDESIRLTLKLADLEYTDDSKFPFTLSWNRKAIYALVVTNATKPTVLSGWEVWKRKFASKKSVLYSKREDPKNPSNHIISLEHATKLYYPHRLYKEDLLLEEKFVELGLTSLEEDKHGGYGLAEDFLPQEIKGVFDEIIGYFRSTIGGRYRLLPSTTHIDEKLAEIYKRYTEIYFSLLAKIQANEALSKQHLALLNLGTIKKWSDMGRLMFTPLHPLMVSYQLMIRENVAIKELSDEIIQKFTPLNLLPFINNGSNQRDYFIAVDQAHSPEWLYYVNAQIEGQSINRRNVPEMMSEKIKEFVKHFSYLYIDQDAPIRLNLINLGDCKEALQGVFAYFISSVRELVASSKSPEEIYPLHINIYGSGSYVTKFEQFSRFDDIESIKKVFEIDLGAIKKLVEPEDLLKLYHQKVRFFVKEGDTNSVDEFEYAHLSFHQFAEKDLERADNDTKEVSTGISLNGIFSDLPSIYSNGNYRTGYGVRSLPDSGQSQLVKISRQLNAIANVSGTATIFKPNYSFASVVNLDTRTKLKKIYDSSQWVTFINPMVDLSFFKSETDVVIIHYTDHYNNSSGYDSITITNKWEQYKFILNDYLKDKVENIGAHIKPIINMFNAVNGYWLLKLGSQNSREKIDKEKISILSAVKEMLAILDHPKIAWVMLSLEEILRVTGAAGLKQSEGLFSAKNLNKSGMLSDDLLAVGIEEIENDIILYFYPIEVKLGHNQSEVLKKGEYQGAQTYDLLRTTLTQDGFNGKLYRNYFAKLILNAAQKLSLYGVWPEYSHRWDQIEKLRGRLLNDDFTLGTLEDFIGNFAVLSFKESSNFSKRSIKLSESFMMINLYDSDGLNDLTKSVKQLRDRYTDQDAIGIKAEDLLETKYVFNGKKLLASSIVAIVDSPKVGEDDTVDSTSDFPNLSEQKEGAEVVKATDFGPLKILFGHRESNGLPLEWYPTSSDKVLHTNTGIIGTMGTGKTQFTKSIVTQFFRNSASNLSGKKIGILIFDYKGDYIKKDFVEATNAKIYELDRLPYNPLALAIGEKPKKKLPVHTASTFLETLSKAYNLGHVQTLELKEILSEAYENAGIYKDDITSWNKPAPTMNDVFELYLSNEKVKKDSLYAALDKLNDFEIFEPISTKTTPLYDLIDGVTIINLNGYSTEIQNLVVAITLDQFYAQMQIHGHSELSGNIRQINKLILVDEADNFLSKNFESLRKILKEGREYGVGTILSTQFLNHFSTSDNEYTQYILTWIIHRVSEINDKEVGSIFTLPSKQQRASLINTIKELDKHYSVINLAGSAPIKIKDKAFWELI